MYACHLRFVFFFFFLWGILPLQSDWSLSCGLGLDYASLCENGSKGVPFITRARKERLTHVSFPTILARLAELNLEPWVCPRQQLLRDILKGSKTLRPLSVRLTNLSYW